LTITVSRSKWQYVAEVIAESDAAVPLVICHPGEINPGSEPPGECTACDQTESKQSTVSPTSRKIWFHSEVDPAVLAGYRRNLHRVRELDVAAGGEEWLAGCDSSHQGHGLTVTAFCPSPAFDDCSHAANQKNPESA
jgi:hypothetical protein